MRIKIFIVLLLIFFVNTIEAKRHSFSQLHKMPKSLAKDYYIWRFLQQKKTTKSQAKKIVKELSHINTKLAKAYWKKTYKSIPEPKKDKIIVTKASDRAWRQRSKAHKHFKMGLALLKQKKPNEDHIWCYEK